MRQAPDLAEDRRRDISDKTSNGLEPAGNRGRVGRCPRVTDDDKRAIIVARRAKGESIRVSAICVSIVWGVLNETKADAP